MKQFLERPLISVIIPTYDRAGIIGIPLKSVLKQSYKNLEIIVVDDASTEPVNIPDGSRIQLIRLPVNSGGAVARNLGLKAVQGK